MKISRFLPVLFLVSLPSIVRAETAEQQQTRVDRLEQAVLAPCCYAQSLAIHQSEIAVKMRLQIAKWVAAGKSDRDILDTYVGLYGSKVLVDPRTAPRWWMQWVPWLVLGLGVAGGIWLLRQWQPKPAIEPLAGGDQPLELPDFDDE